MADDETRAYTFEDQSLVAGVLAEINVSGPNSAEFRDARLILAALSAAGWGDTTALRAQLADVSDAHHEGFGAGVEWADERTDTPQTDTGALEAAAEAIYRARDVFGVRGNVLWAELPEPTRELYRELVRAAAPIIERDALQRAADALSVIAAGRRWTETFAQGVRYAAAQVRHMVHEQAGGGA